MYDVLAYLIESYRDWSACPAHDILSRRLNAVGFEHEAVHAALTWLNDLEHARQHLLAPRADSIRVLSAQEQAHIPLACQSLLRFLENHHSLDHDLREIVIDRLMALPSDHLTLNTLRLIVIAVLWHVSADLDVLMADYLTDSEFLTTTLQ